jgi:hypothetical protein
MAFNARTCFSPLTPDVCSLHAHTIPERNSEDVNGFQCDDVSGLSHLFAFQCDDALHLKCRYTFNTTMFQPSHTRSPFNATMRCVSNVAICHHKQQMVFAAHAWSSVLSTTFLSHWEQVFLFTSVCMRSSVANTSCISTVFTKNIYHVAISAILQLSTINDH